MATVAASPGSLEGQGRLVKAPQAAWIIGVAERLSDRVGLCPCLLKIPFVLRGRLALVSLFSPGEVSALFVHDYWSRQ